MELARRCPSLPDQSGVLRLPATLQMHPDVASEAIEVWARFPDRPLDWVHSSVGNRERRARAERLLDGTRVAAITDWLEALVGVPTPAASAAAISVAARLMQSDSLTGAQKVEVQSSRIILVASGNLRPPDSSRVFLESTNTQGFEIVHPDVLAYEGCRSDLAILGIGELDVEGEIRALLARSHSPELDWDHFWESSRNLDPRRFGHIVSEQSSVARRRMRVRTASGTFSRIDAVLLPGMIADQSRDDHVAVDLQYHAEDVGVLKSIGVSETPRAGGGTVEEGWFGEYLTAALEKYEEEIRKTPGQNPSRELVAFEESSYLGPLEPYAKLSPESQALFAQFLISQTGQFGTWHLAHSSRPASYPRITVASPPRWLMLNHGRVMTSQGLREVRDT